MDNYFGHVLGEQLQPNEIGYIFTHNRGAGYISDFETQQQNPDGSQAFVQIGALYEHFAESELDIDAWLQEAINFGYKRIIIVGHSFGGPKVMNYFWKKQPLTVHGIILASPADMVGLVMAPNSKTDYEYLLQEATQLVSMNQPRTLLSKRVWECYQVSAQTFLDIFAENGPGDVFPILKNPTTFLALASINQPILCLMGENDDIIIRGLEKDLELIRQKATNCLSFTSEIIPGADHCYRGKETQFAEIILQWIKHTIMTPNNLPAPV